MTENNEQAAKSRAQNTPHTISNGEPKVLPFPKFPKPTVRVTLWEERGKPNEATLRARLTEEGYGVVRWDNEPATGYAPMRTSTLNCYG